MWYELWDVPQRHNALPGVLLGVYLGVTPLDGVVLVQLYFKNFGERWLRITRRGQFGYGYFAGEVWRAARAVRPLLRQHGGAGGSRVALRSHMRCQTSHVVAQPLEWLKPAQQTARETLPGAARNGGR